MIKKMSIIKLAYLILLTYTPWLLALDADIKVTTNGQPIWEHQGDEIAFLIPIEQGSIVAQRTYQANVTIHPSPNNEAILKPKIQYKWTAGDLTLIGADTATCTIKTNKPEQWGKLHIITCTATISNGTTTITKTDNCQAITPAFNIKEIHFNYDTTNRLSDAMNLNEKFKLNTIVAPEWTPQSSKPFLYQTDMKAVIQVKINLLPDLLEIATVKAASPHASESFFGPLKETAIQSNELSLVTALNKFPDTLDVSKQTWTWTLTSIEGVNITPERIITQTTTSEGYRIFVGMLPPPWSEDDPLYYPWVEALHTVLEKSKCKGIGIQDRKTVVANITKYLFFEHQMVYDTEDFNASHFAQYPSLTITNTEEETNESATWDFLLNNYLTKDRNNKVNCVDQAGALSTLASLVNSEVQTEMFIGIIMPPFGTGVVGLKKFSSTFNAHSFCHLSVKNKLLCFDATFGPSLGLAFPLFAEKILGAPPNLTVPPGEDDEDYTQWAHNHKLFFQLK